MADILINGTAIIACAIFVAWLIVVLREGSY